MTGALVTFLALWLYVEASLLAARWALFRFTGYRCARQLKAAKLTPGCPFNAQMALARLLDSHRREFAGLP